MCLQARYIADISALTATSQRSVRCGWNLRVTIRWIAYQQWMITGVHAIVYSKHAESVRAFLSDVLGLDSVDAGGGWPIFAGPPLEIAVHPTDGEPEHELFLMCDDVRAVAAMLAQRGIQTEPIADRSWGLATSIELAGGERIGLYEPHHPSPLKR